MKHAIAAAAILASALGSQAFAATVSIPDTPAGHALGVWINAVNSGDAKTLQAYIDTYHRKSKPETWIELHKITGDLSVLKLVKNEPNDIYAIIGESETDDVLYAKYTLDPKDPTNVTFGEVGGMDRPADLAIPRVSQDEAVKALVAKIDGLAAQDK